MEEEVGQRVDSFIDMLHSVHCDNSKQQYFAERGGRRISTMPLTPFVYEFFLFNSLYQVDWNESDIKEDLVFHSDEWTESRKQRDFAKFLRSHARNNPSHFYRAFEPLICLPKIEGKWTTVAPSERISAEEGRRFFEKTRLLQELIESCDDPGEMPTTKKTFDMMDQGIRFVYSVRNNIFHGSKTLGAIYDADQKRRIELYELFLKGVTSLFFLAVGKNAVASDFSSCPIFSSSLPAIQEREVLSQEAVGAATGRGLMKPGDSRLILRFTKSVAPPRDAPSDKSSLFYPSSGTDFLTPLLLGLPYCTQFFFFDCGQTRRTPNIASILRKIPSTKLDCSSRPSKWSRRDNARYFDFEFDSIPRRIHWIQSDNIDFLRMKVELAFYFHRGDSVGEGGSGQLWDSEFLSELTGMVPDGKRCIFLTDGEPGGIDENRMESCDVLSVPFLERARPYYFGHLVGRVVDWVDRETVPSMSPRGDPFDPAD
jgi:hypothetical protein